MRISDQDQGAEELRSRFGRAPAVEIPGRERMRNAHRQADTCRIRELQKEGIELLKELTKGLLVAQERKKDPEKKPEHEFSLYSFRY